MVNYWDKYTKMHGQQNVKSQNYISLSNYFIIIIIIIFITMDNAYCLEIMEASNFWNPKGLSRLYYVRYIIVHAFKNF